MRAYPALTTRAECSPFRSRMGRGRRKGAEPRAPRRACGCPILCQLDDLRCCWPVRFGMIGVCDVATRVLIFCQFSAWTALLMRSQASKTAEILVLRLWGAKTCYRCDELRFR
jgi:hypothetical protein